MKAVQIKFYCLTKSFDIWSITTGMFGLDARCLPIGCFVVPPFVLLATRRGRQLRDWGDWDWRHWSRRRHWHGTRSGQLDRRQQDRRGLWYWGAGWHVDLDHFVDHNGAGLSGAGWDRFGRCDTAGLFASARLAGFAALVSATQLILSATVSLILAAFVGSVFFLFRRFLAVAAAGLIIRRLGRLGGSGRLTTVGRVQRVFDFAHIDHNGDGDFDRAAAQFQLQRSVSGFLFQLVGAFLQRIFAAFEFDFGFFVFELNVIHGRRGDF